MKESTLNPVAEALLRLIPNGNPDSLFKGYAAFAMIPELKKMTSWLYDHAAFRDDAFCPVIKKYYAKNPHAGFFSCEESGCVLLRACKANCG